MSIETVIQGLGLLGVLGLSLWELGREESRRLLPRLGGGARCPYCHADLDEAAPERPRVRCVRCGTTHHEDCWVEHARCSVHGCGSDRAGRRRPSQQVAVNGMAPDTPPTIVGMPGAKGSTQGADSRPSAVEAEGAATEARVEPATLG